MSAKQGAGWPKIAAWPSDERRLALHRARRAAEPAGRGARRRRPGRAYMRDLGLEVDEDDAGAADRLERGEPLRAGRADGRAGTPLFLCAHLDTVPPEAAIEPVVEDGVIRNAAGTILGADNKAAVAVMLEATRRVLAENRPHGGIELLFTPKEEVGLARRRGLRPRAARRPDRLRLRPGGADRRGDPRRAVRALDGGAASTGAPRTPGMYPEEGRSAIAAAAKAIADFQLGRIDEETTANVGLISGGTRRQHRPRVVHVPRRGALARRAEARRPRPGDAGGGHVRRRARGVRGRDRGAQELQRLPLQARRSRGPARARRRSSVRLRAVVQRSAAARPTRTSSTSAGSPASTSRTGWRRSTRPTSTSPSPISSAWSTSRSRSSTSRARRMPLSLRRGHRHRHRRATRGARAGSRWTARPCVAYPRLTGPVELGDEVVVNVQARELGLGSGGFDVLYVNLTRGLGLAAEPGRARDDAPVHAAAARGALRGGGRRAGGDLDGMPVVCCSLHSPARSGLRRSRRGRASRLRPAPRRRAARLALGLGARAEGARPRRAGGRDRRVLRRRRAGRRRRLRARLGRGRRGSTSRSARSAPGSSAPARRLGHGGVAAAEAANAASALGGSPVLAVRVSEGDARERHRGRLAPHARGARARARRGVGSRGRPGSRLRTGSRSERRWT